jgi:hypothetical protein
MASTMIFPGTTNVSDYSSRRVMLEVTGGRSASRLGTYTMSVPYNCLSQTIRSIHRLGGKVNQVMMTPNQQPAQVEAAAPEETQQVVAQKSKRKR